VFVRLKVRAPGAGGPATVPLEFCRVDRPLIPATFCSQPLYGYHELRKQLPWIMEDWLDYHLGHLGFMHAEIYDIDGSFETALEPWVRASSWGGTTVTYHRRWPARLSPQMEALSRDHPYCTETYAYAHCLTTHRALSRWVALLHAPDEYLFVRKNPSRGALLEVLELQESELPEDEVLPFLQVNGLSFARGGPGAEETSGQERGAVLATSRLRVPWYYHHMPVLDPATCICAGPHMCYAEVGDQHRYGGFSKEVPPGQLMVYHYVEMLPQHRGRCSTLNAEMLPCEVADDTAAWVVPFLRDV